MPLAGPEIGRPLNMTSPLLGGSRPEMTLSRVDLPQPDGPTTERKLPLPIRQDRLSNTVSALPLTKKTLLIALASMIAAPAALPAMTVSFGLPGLIITPGLSPAGCWRCILRSRGQTDSSA